jgi:LPS-assembly protein
VIASTAFVLPALFGQLLSAPQARQGELISDEQIYNTDTKVVVARGHAALRARGVTLWADEVIYDQVNQRATAIGNVMMVRGLIAAFGERVDVDLSSDQATVERGLVLQKRNVPPERLLALKSPEELMKVGQTALALTGQRVQRVDDHRFLVDHLSFTPCDCDPAHPSWRIDSIHADLTEGERANLLLPIIYVHSVPIFALPWISLPLNDRSTGLLPIHPTITTLNGFSLDLPVFITLGDSYDMTLTPGYYFGAKRDSITGNFPTSGISGPRLQTEFRYIPSPQMSGRASLGFIDDRRPLRDAVTGSFLEPNRPRGLRWDAGLQHAQELGAGWSGRIDAFAASDGNYIRDLQADVIARTEGYLRSTAVVFHRDSDSYAGLDVALRQDMRFGYRLFGEDYTSNGTLEPGPNTLQRLPGITYDIPERPILGPAVAGLRLEYSRIAPLHGLSSFNLFLPPDILQGEREARDRIDFRPRISAGFAAGRFARFTPYLSYRDDLYIGEVTGKVFHRGYPMLGVISETELARAFTLKDGMLRHAITPSFEIRYVPPVFGHAWPIPYDEVDVAVPHQGVFQAIAQVSQKFALRKGQSTSELLRFDLGQDLDLRGSRAGDSFARSAFTYGIVNATALMRYDIPGNRFTQLAIYLNIYPAPWISLNGGYDNMTLDGPERFRRGIDALVGSPLPAALVQAEQAIDPSNLGLNRAQQLGAGFGIRLGFGLGIRYGALLKPVQFNPPNSRPRWSLEQQTAAISYSPSCDCWRFEVGVRLGPVRGGFPQTDFTFSLVVFRFGSFGIGG